MFRPWHLSRSQLSFFLMYGMISEEIWTNIYSVQIENQWKANIHTPPNSKLANHWILLELCIGIWVRLLREVETSQRWLHHWSLPLHGWQLMKSGNLELTAQPVGSSTCWTVSFANISFSLSFFWEGLLVSASSRQLEWPLFLPCWLSGLRLV